MILEEFIRNVLLERRASQPVEIFSRKIFQYFQENAPETWKYWHKHLKKFIECSLRDIYIDISGVETALFNSHEGEVYSKFRKMLPELAARYGWQILSRDEDTIILQPQTPVEQIQVGPELFHATPKNNVSNILKRGLIPKFPRSVGDAALRSYEPRIYLSRDLEAHEDMLDNFSANNDEQEYALLSIDTSLLKPGTKFYLDSESTDSVWTRTPIPAKAISVVELDENLEDT
jgi:hypothetical protein